MLLLPLYYGAETAQIWSYHHSNIKFSKLSIWYYDHSNMVIPPISNFQFLLNQKNIYILLKSFLIMMGHYCFKRDYDLKGTLYFEGIYIIERLCF